MRLVPPLLWLFCIILCHCAPIPTEPLLADEQSGQECLFKDYHMKLPSSFPQQSRSRVSCGGKMLSLQKIYDNRKTFGIRLHGADNPVDLMLARIGSFKDTKFWKNKKEVEKLLHHSVCKSHWQELFSQWSRGGYKHYRATANNIPQCYFPQELGGHSTAPFQKLPIGTEHLTKYQAFALLQETNKIVQVGIGLCDEHVTKVKKLQSQYFPDGSTYEEEKKFECKMEKSIMLDHSEQRHDYVKEFVANLGYCKLPTISNYDDLSSLTKAIKIRKTKKLFLEIVGIISPENREGYLQEVCKSYEDSASSENVLHQICTEVAKEYRKAGDDKMMRMFALASVVNVVSYPELRKFIPNLTEYTFRQAKKHSRYTDLPTGVQNKRRYVRYEKEEIKKFVNFLTSPFCMISMPYGVRHATLSDKTKIDIPVTIRLQRHAEIIKMYTAKRQEEDPHWNALTRATMYDILHHCYAVRSKALTCIDYYLADGAEGFDYLEKTINEWQALGVMEELDGNILKKRLSEGRLYLRTDFNIALNEHSPILSHCITYALSDSKDIKFQRKCDTSSSVRHTILCERCEQLKEALLEVEEFAYKLCELCENDPECKETDADDRTVQAALVKDATFNIREMKKHVVRTRFSEMQRKSIIATLNESFALVTLDFAQKFLPSKHRESQRDYFGKKGISYHISHVMANISGSIVEHSYVHILEGLDQDSNVVVAIIIDVLSNITKCGITEVVLRSDNAGCYHGNVVVQSLQKISEITGVRILRYAFSEPQAGKSACDRKAAHVKNRLRDFVDQIGKVENPEQFFTALTTPTALSNTTISTSSIEASTLTVTKNIVGVSQLYDIVLESDGLRAYKFYGIGDGQKFKYSDYHVNQKLPKLIHNHIYNPLDNGPCSNYWRLSAPTKKKKSSVAEKETFFCPEEVCDATFKSYAELEAHITAGVHHDRQLEQQTQADYAVCQFVDAIADRFSVKDNSIEAAIRNQIIEDSHLTNLDSLSQGWAHKCAKENPKFTPDSKAFLTELFDKGELSKHKTNGPEAVMAMRAAKTPTGGKRFQPHEYLRPEQIVSFFSRVSAARKQAAADGVPAKRRKPNKPSSDVNGNVGSEDASEDSDLSDEIVLTKQRRYNLRQRREQEIEEMVENVYNEYDLNDD